MKILLDRFAESVDGTFGRLYIPIESKSMFAYTLEEEWRDNEPNESRIPVGTYVCERTAYHKMDDLPTFEIMNVPGRSRILFHPGNTEEDTQGCVLLGGGMGPLAVEDEDDAGRKRMKLGIYGSRPAFRRFMAALEGVGSFDLVITNPEWRI